MLFHRSDLDWRGMRSEKQILTDVERVLIFTGRVSLRNIQRFEIVIVSLDLGSQKDAESHSHEYLLHLTEDPPDRVD